jgi:outer membrane protein assembly factor BamB
MIYALLALALVGTAAQAAAGTAVITLSKRVGPPSTSTSVSGVGFGANETVTIKFDSTTVGSATTDGGGSFPATAIIVPRSARPGSHQVCTRGETSGLTAVAPFRVQTDWRLSRFSPNGDGVNPYENVIGATNVSGLTQLWDAPTGD